MLYNKFNYSNYNKCYPPFKMKVYGRGSVMVEPDIAIVTLGVFTEDMELQKAQDENTKTMNRIINTLKKMGIPSKDIQTESYTINPQYDYVNGNQVFKGYRVTHTIKVTIRDLNMVGEVIDNAVKQGANIVNNINFTVSEPFQYYKQALNKAINNSIDKAKTIGEELRVQVSTTPIQIIEKGIESSIAPTLYKATDAVPPIQTGEIEIVANIEAIFTYIK